MLTTVSFSGRMEQFLRQIGVVRFDIHVISDDQGFQAYKLCAEQKRHYSVKFRKGEGHHVSSTSTICDRSCAGGKLVENPNPELLLAVEINKRVPAGHILMVLQEQYHIKAHKEYAAGTIVGPEVFSSGRLLKNGESMEVIRTLNHNERIDLTPMPVNGGNWRRVREQEKVITEILDKITNVGGQALVTNNEVELRAERDRINQEFQAGIKKVEDERKKRGQDYARGATRYLRFECGFSKEETDKIFRTVGPALCRDAVVRARQKMAEAQKPIEDLSFGNDWDDIDLMGRLEFYGERKDWRRIEAGADYIINVVGGVPADKKKKEGK